MPGTGKEMREERERARERVAEAGAEGRQGRGEQENGAEGNLLNVATKWNGN